MKNHGNIAWTLLVGAVLMVGCGKEIPKEIIQPDRMENILYDYHLSISMANNLSYSENYQKEAYKNYVFDKHHVSEAEFDSSMVWYTRHTEELAAIYKRLGERFRSEKKHVQTLLALRENKPAISLPGDTVDVWYDRKLYWLTNTPLSNRIAFEVPVDSNFKAKDAFVWSVDYTFLAEGSQKAIMGFNILFENDSVVGNVKDITHSGVQALYIKPDSAFAVRSVNGFIYYMGDASENAQGLILSNLSLTRYHEPVDTTMIVAKDSAIIGGKEKEDSVVTDRKIDTVRTEELKKDVPVRLNPREMKEHNTERSGSDQKLKIDRSQRIRRRN